jgi:energy-coupling factor transport system permease protein
MIKNVDPRTKLISVMFISSLALIFENIISLLILFAAGIFLVIAFNAPFFNLIKRLKHILYLFFAMIIIQSIFLNTGDVIIGLNGFKILTTDGIQRGIGYLMRILIILLSASILSTCSTRTLIQGLIQMKIPYEIAFMTSIGIKFLPLFVEEIKDTLTAIQLRGINLKELSFKDRLEIFSYLFTPIIAGALNKSKKLSLSIECRGFRAYDRRTSIINLKLSNIDYSIIFSIFAFSILIILINPII